MAADRSIGQTERPFERVCRTNRESERERERASAIKAKERKRRRRLTGSGRRCTQWQLVVAKAVGSKVVDGKGGGGWRERGEERLG
jgi:hypothetical protein